MLAFLRKILCPSSEAVASTLTTLAKVTAEREDLARRVAAVDAMLTQAKVALAQAESERSRFEAMARDTMHNLVTAEQTAAALAEDVKAAKAEALAAAAGGTTAVAEATAYLDTIYTALIALRDGAAPFVAYADDATTAPTPVYPDDYDVLADAYSLASSLIGEIESERAAADVDPVAP